MTISERGAIWYLLDLSIHLDYLSGNRSVTPIGWDCERYCERCRRKKVNLDKDLLAILCCPETKQAVALADEQLIQKVNGAIERGALKNKAHKPVTEKLDGGLIRSDNKILYPVREDIPVMLIDEGIPLEQVS
ncbi:MAG: hypothetical protein IPM88_06125 [Nitrospira sp.]|nr:hypothetical protein [Nitrospira sp.]